MQTHCDLTAWHHTQINVKPDLVSIDLAQLDFCLAYKNSSRDGIDCHTQVILQLSEDKLSIYLMKRESWPNTSYFLFKSHFPNCSLRFDTPYIKHLSFGCVCHQFSQFCKFWNKLLLLKLAKISSPHLQIKMIIWYL